MKRNTLNLVVDSAALLAFVLLGSTGLVLDWTLPPGSGRLDAPGCLPDRQVLVLWGLSRHEWGRLHLWVSWVFLGILVLHLALHWRWIKVTLARQTESGITYCGKRLVLGTVAALLLVGAVSPLFGRPHSVARSQTVAVAGPALYRAHCQKCHADPEEFRPWPADSGAALARLREARPEKSHQGLRQLSENDQQVLLDYLRQP